MTARRFRRDIEMLTRRTTLFAAVGLLAAMAAGPVRADAPASKPFDAAAFEEALAAGKPIFVEISAPWCPICKTQKPIIGKLLADPRFKTLTAYDVDFDTGKAHVRKLGATAQSTLLVYKGGKEVGRSVGETQPEWIEELLEKAL